MLVTSSQAGLVLLSTPPPAQTKGMHLGTGRAGDCSLLTGEVRHDMTVQVPVRIRGSAG